MDVNLSGMFADIGLMAVLCFIFGLLLVFFEAFIPGFGLPGLLGVGLLVAGIVLTAGNLGEVLFLVLLLLLILGLAFMIMWNSVTKGKLAQTTILNETQSKAAGFSGTEDLSRFLNCRGVALTTLRPAGTAEFDGVKVDVVAEGEFIERGVTVQVIKVEGRRVIVRGVTG
ncbi:MAG: NfeD family protein [Bacillota bacterium]|jgi:membrane-bound ClpP family serine protease